jgi:hypothetical protein
MERGGGDAAVACLCFGVGWVSRVELSRVQWGKPSRAVHHRFLSRATPRGSISISIRATRNSSHSLQIKQRRQY